MHNASLLVLKALAFSIVFIAETALVNELQRVLLPRSMFARSKFDLFKRDASCLIQAFRSLITQILIGDSAMWKMRLLAALGSDGRVVTDVIPELRRLIGDQPAVPQLNPAETAQRFARVFIGFVHALSPPGSPLTVFIDDRQPQPKYTFASGRVALKDYLLCLLQLSIILPSLPFS